MHSWPSLKSYRGAHLRRINLPLGGIGTGTIGLGGRGQLQNFEIINRPALGFTPERTFFALRTQTVSGEVFCRLLEGPLAAEDYEGSDGARLPNHGYPRFEEAVFEAAYPLGQVHLRDKHCPLEVTLQAFNPFVPGDLDASGLPAAILRYRLTNPTSDPVQAAITGSLHNFLGTDGVEGESADGVNTVLAFDGANLISLTSPLPEDSPYKGSLALGLLDGADEVTSRTIWLSLPWWQNALEFWEDFSADGRLSQPKPAPDKKTDPTAGLCGAVTIEPGETRELAFILTWHFPNRLSWTPEGKSAFLGPPQRGGANRVGPPIIGNHYTTRFADATDVIRQLLPALPDLERRTLAFADAFYNSSLPDVVKEAAGFNLSTLRTNTLFRTPDGRFYGYEGLHDQHGSCFGSCTHVWNYEQTTPFLFAGIARSFRETEYQWMTGENGHMSFRVSLPLEPYARNMGLAAADGQMGCLMKLYRDWKLCGDDNWLRELWPAARRSLEFCWLEGGWDGNQDGVMEGSQHNTMDVEYFGPNPQMQGWYLGALRSAEEMANALGETEFATRCHELFERGSVWADEHLFNGEFYEHHITPVPEKLAPGTGGGWQNRENPELQLGAACLVDQLVGQYMAEVCGLGLLLAPAHIRSTLDSVLKYNHLDNFLGHFNFMRSYVLGDEKALLMASYPRGNRPTNPFPYFTEVMTGFEHTVAAHLIYAGETEAGLRVIQDIRDRYDGRKRNPFDEAECGRHYARAMAAWAHVLALTGFAWDGHTGTMTFNAAREPANWFWSNGTSWGTLRQTPATDGLKVELKVLHGKLPIRQLEVRGAGTIAVSGSGTWLL